MDDEIRSKNYESAWWVLSRFRLTSSESGVETDGSLLRQHGESVGQAHVSRESPKVNESRKGCGERKEEEEEEEGGGGGGGGNGNGGWGSAM